MKNFTQKIWHGIKIFWGCIFILEIPVSIFAAQNMDDSQNPFIMSLVCSAVFAALAYLCFKKPKSSKTPPANQSSQHMTSPQNANTTTSPIPLWENVSLNIGGPTPAELVSQNNAPNNISTNYDNVILPNGNSITEQQQADFKIATGIYPKSTSTFYNMRIVSSVIPPQKGYNILNENEQLFFKNFYEQLLNNRLHPEQIRLTRLSNGAFNVDYSPVCYVGKINLFQEPEKYAVYRQGNQRATRVFSSRQEALDYIGIKSDYFIKVSGGTGHGSMQCLKGSYNPKEYTGLTVAQCIENIPQWIRYIKYCRRN